MESILIFIGSVNKISLIAFLGVLCFLIYEVYLWRKDRLKKTKPVIPTFNPETVVKTQSPQAYANQTPSQTPSPVAIKTKQKAPIALIAILGIMSVLFISLTLFMVFSKRFDS